MTTLEFDPSFIEAIEHLDRYTTLPGRAASSAELVAAVGQCLAKDPVPSSNIIRLNFSLSLSSCSLSPPVRTKRKVLTKM